MRILSCNCNWISITPIYKKITHVSYRDNEINAIIINFSIEIIWEESANISNRYNGWKTIWPFKFSLTPKNEINRISVILSLVVPNITDYLFLIMKVNKCNMYLLNIIVILKKQFISLIINTWFYKSSWQD